MDATKHQQEATSLLGLVAGLREDVRRLFHEEVRLAKTEISEKVSCFSRNGMSLAAGVLGACIAVLFLLVSLSILIGIGFRTLGLGAAMASLLGFLSTAAVCGITAAILIATSLRAISKGSLLPEKTIESLKEIKEGGLEQNRVPIKTYPAAATPEDTRTSDQIRADLERTRGRIGREMRGIRTRLSLGSLAARAAHRVSRDPVRSVSIGLGTGLAGFILMRLARPFARRRQPASSPV